jgi:hypothetical protein
MSQSQSTSTDAKTSSDWLFTPDTIESIRSLSSVLEGVHKRLIQEGYVIKDGIILKSHENK